MIDYYEYSIPELIELLGRRFKDYRLRSEMTQRDVADQSGIAINTIHKFENGKARQRVAWHLPLANESYWMRRSVGRCPSRATRVCVFDE